MLTLLTSQAQKINLSDSIITCNGVAGLKLGMTFKDILKQNPDFNFTTKGVGYGIDGNGTGYTVSHQKDTLFFLYDKKGTLDSLGGIVILSQKFETKKGIKIGTTVSVISTKYDSLSIGHSFDYSAYEYIGPKDLECGEVNNDRNASFAIFEFIGQNVGIFKEPLDSYTSKIKNRNAKVDFISIYFFH